MEIFTNFILQILLTVGVIVLFGLLIALCRRLFCKLTGDVGPKILLATGIIGTPVHELSHALMCVLFGHKIVKIKLYQIPGKGDGETDGALGYVSHTYNPKNLYHQIGNFFIGVAPILVGSGVLMLLMFLLVPEVFSDVISELDYIKLITFDLFDASMYADIFQLFWDVIKAIFGWANWSSILWWLFLILSLTIASHMEISVPDIKSGVKGFLFIAGLLLVVDVILYFISISVLEAVTSAFASFSFLITGFLAIAGIFSGLLVLCALAVKGVKKIFKK